jgi:hypothetical protein
MLDIEHFYARVKGRRPNAHSVVLRLSLSSNANDTTSTFGRARCAEYPAALTAQEPTQATINGLSNGETLRPAV